MASCRQRCGVAAWAGWEQVPVGDRSVPPAASRGACLGCDGRGQLGH